MVNPLKKVLGLVSPHGDARLIYRVLAEQAAAHWKSYLTALMLMAVSAGATAAAAYLLGPVVNAIYTDRNLASLLVLCVITIMLFCSKGLATYGQAVLLARISNRVTAENQRRIFDKLVQEGIGYFADRHSSASVRLQTRHEQERCCSKVLLPKSAGARSWPVSSSTRRTTRRGWRH